MKIKSQFFQIKWMISVFLILALSGCLTQSRLRKDPFYESFYEKTRLIMTEEEDQIYRALKDPEDKEEFIREFWQIRDPDPSTEENEAKLQFEERIDYANRWLGDWRDASTQPMRGERAERYRGWNTERGRVYVVLGEPDFVNYGTGFEPIQEHRMNRGGYQSWYYNRYDLMISFSYENGHWRMGLYTSVPIAMEQAKMEMIGLAFREEVEARFRFRAVWKNDGVELIIPAKRVRFEEIEGKLEAEIAVSIRIYRNDQRHEVIDRSRSFTYTEDDVSYLKEIRVHIPCRPKDKGRYLFDIIATDAKSLTLGRYRSYIKKRF